MIFLHNTICCKSERLGIWHENSFKSFGASLVEFTRSPSKIRPEELLGASLKEAVAWAGSLAVLSYQIREVQCLQNWNQSEGIIKIVYGWIMKLVYWENYAKTIIVSFRYLKHDTLQNNIRLHPHTFLSSLW